MYKVFENLLAKLKWNFIHWARFVKKVDSHFSKDRKTLLIWKHTELETSNIIKLDFALKNLSYKGSYNIAASIKGDSLAIILYNPRTRSVTLNLKDYYNIEELISIIERHINYYIIEFDKQGVAKK